jgi:hypothetical protein
VVEGAGLHARRCHCADREEHRRHFERLEAEGICLSAGAEGLVPEEGPHAGRRHEREYPSTPDEAFEQALEVAYFARQLAAAERQGRIGPFPLDPRTPSTPSGASANDQNVIWLNQWVGDFNRFVGYYENSGEFIGHYVSWLREWVRERDAVFGEHYLPHDGDRESLWLENGTMGAMDGLGFRPSVAERPKVKGEAIASAHEIPVLPVRRGGLRSRRQAAAALPQGMGRQAWRLEGQARDDDSCHAADAFMTFACSGYEMPVRHIRTKPDLSWVV